MGFFLFLPIRDSIYRAILSRPNVSRGGVRRPVWTWTLLGVDPLIHGRDLQARAMLLHAMRRHNANGYPLSLLEE